MNQFFVVFMWRLIKTVFLNFLAPPKIQCTKSLKKPDIEKPLKPCPKVLAATATVKSKINIQSGSSITKANTDTHSQCSSVSSVKSFVTVNILLSFLAYKILLLFTLQLVYKIILSNIVFFYAFFNPYLMFQPKPVKVHSTGSIKKTLPPCKNVTKQEIKINDDVVKAQEVEIR